MTAGVRVFARSGFSGSSVSDICAEAGLSRRQFYELYADKAALFRVVYDDINERGRAAVDRIAAADVGTVSDIVRACIHAFLDILGDRDLMRVGFSEIDSVGGDFEEHRRAGRQRWGDLIANALAGHRDPIELRPWQARAYIGAVNGVVREWATDPEQPPIAELEDILTAMFVALLPEH
jgi:AcrR family transcriptional regulator